MNEKSGIATSVPANSFLGRFVREHSCTRTRSCEETGSVFFFAWAVFFFILWIMPLPEGMSHAGKSTLAVLAWATTMWITEALPVGITGLIIPMLLVMGEAPASFRRLPTALASLWFLTLAAFIFAAIIQAAGLDRRIALTLLKNFA